MSDFERKWQMDAEMEKKAIWESTKKDIKEYSRRLEEKWKNYFFVEYELSRDEAENIFSIPEEIRTQVYEEYYKNDLFGFPLLFDQVMEHINEDAYGKGADTESEFEMTLENEWEKSGKRSIDFLLGEALSSDKKEDHVDCDLSLIRLRALGYDVYHSIDNEENYEKEIHEMLAKVFYKLFSSYKIKVPPELQIVFTQKQRKKLKEESMPEEASDMALFASPGNTHESAESQNERGKKKAQIEANIQELYKKFDFILDILTVK